MRLVVVLLALAGACSTPRGVGRDRTPSLDYDGGEASSPCDNIEGESPCVIEVVDMGPARAPASCENGGGRGDGAPCKTVGP